MYKLLFKSFFRTKIFVVSLLLLIIVGVISILIGKQFLIKQEKNVIAAQEFQKLSLEKNIEHHPNDLGLLLYYQRFTLIKQQPNISAISIGQSDVNPLLQTVTIRALEGQKYDNDFENPSLLMSGNLDLGFVIIYLFPLVLIALIFNLYSEEKEIGTWKLLASQTAKKTNFLLKKLIVRLALVFTVLLLLLFLASALLDIPMSSPFWAIVLQSIIYLTFWSAISLWVVSFQKSSSFNALTLISAWVLLTILIPAMVNNYVIHKYQVPEALHTIVEQRDGYHEKWDMEKHVTMDGFLKEYPQFSNYNVPEDEFSWIWYYGMQHMGDINARETSIEMKEKLILRDKVSKNIALFIPTMYTQLSFNKIASTDMVSHLHFLDKLSEYHSNLRLGFYSKIFDKNSAETVNWKNYNSKFTKMSSKINWRTLFIPTLIFIILLTVISYFNLKKL
ncbi:MULTISPECIES: DUF3526 domain-containing protein [unclassified Cellulophaga]|uniref:DUF3526 domain-containing protein n=1 Tax=unclassified Cellulophaga TaxID=2634405 RepID=UPI0026E2A4FD|nr:MULTISPECIES: DUF3526 domain-containing protein [unclassified Cellulophaga]MDO6490454.1 DUF3526 domain-containing protein [Cellulophaga sp. 2_MG-2023]MDO6494352.1 DUF3526 domain-containing protein [Cellulophaga sp. 3_MG-2023]